MTRALWCVVLVACTHGRQAAWSPPPVLDVLEIHGDLILRGEADSSISVTAQVSLDDAVAFGGIRLRTLDLVAARSSAHVVVARARAWQALSRMPTVSADRAVEAASRGIASLPACPGDDPLRQLKPSLAPAVLRQMRSHLEARLRCYVTTHHQEVW